MSGKENLINLKTIDQERAREIRSLGGKARQEQRRKTLSLHNFFTDYFKTSFFYDKELEKVLDSNPQLNSYQKKIIKNEFMLYLMERGLIREAQLTEEERKAIVSSNMEFDPKALKKYFKTRTPYKHKRGPKKHHRKKRGLAFEPKASSKQ